MYLLVQVFGMTPTEIKELAPTVQQPIMCSEEPLFDE